MNQKWNNNEIKKLFTTVEKNKQSGKPVQIAFTTYAGVSGRKPNSVRNFYYNLLNELKNNNVLLNKLNIDLKLHQVNNIKPFTNENSKELYDKIKKLCDGGMSVRKACLNLAKGNLQDMVRFQNKYRLLANDKKPTISPTVIKFPTLNQHNKLSDDEIKSLFLGLVKIVKQSAISQVSDSLKSEAEFTSDTLRKTLIEITEKNRKIADLQKQNKTLFSKNLELEQKLVQLRTMFLKKDKQNQINVD